MEMELDGRPVETVCAGAPNGPHLRSLVFERSGRKPRCQVHVLSRRAGAVMDELRSVLSLRNLVF